VLHINISQAPFDNIKVRQAVAHAIDRDELARLGPFTYRAATSCVPAGIDLAPSDLTQPRLLLREAGYPDGFAVRIIHGAAGHARNHPGSSGYSCNVRGSCSSSTWSSVRYFTSRSAAT
jgi:ABC-type transport system substrate-binding protein